MDEDGAELAEGFSGRDDYAPLVRTELEAFDPEGCEAVARLGLTVCSPR